MRKKILISVFTFLLYTLHITLYTVFANSGASFLNIGTSARAISMGGAYVGVCSDASAINYNPAGLSQLSKKEITAQHTEWISDVRHDFLAFAMPLSSIVHSATESLANRRPSSIGMSVVYLSMGKLEGRDENRQKTDSFKASDVATTFSYSTVIAQDVIANGVKQSQLSLGTNVKVIQQRIEDETATGLAMDIGTKLQITNYKLQIGCVIQNLGPKMTFISEGYNLPLTATIGAGYNIKNAVTLALDIKRKIYDQKTEVSFGTEYVPLSPLALRLGYLKSFNVERSTINELKSLGGGLGLNIFNFSTDYAFVPYGDLGNTHRVSFSVRF